MAASRKKRSSSLTREHFAQRRRQAHRDAEGQSVALQGFELQQQRDIGFGNRLVQPLLFQKTRVFRMAHEGKVRVQDEIQVRH
jgi:hypothetical protein